MLKIDTNKLQFIKTRQKGHFLSMQIAKWGIRVCKENPRRWNFECNYNHTCGFVKEFLTWRLVKNNYSYGFSNETPDVKVWWFFIGFRSSGVEQIGSA